MENAKKRLVFRFGGGRHASFPQKPVVKLLKLFYMMNIVIVISRILLITGWLAIIFGLPALYVLLWCSILIGPWVFCLVGSVMGPILALAVPGYMFAYNNINPINMWLNAKGALMKGNCLV